MRKVVVAADPDGISRVQSIEELSEGRRKDAWYWDGTAAGVPALRGSSELLDLEVAPGAARWIVVDFEPDQLSIFHRTHTIDFDAVIMGEVDLVLGDGEVNLQRGDFLVLLGADHAWRTGSEGCVVACVTLGIGPGS